MLDALLNRGKKKAVIDAAEALPGRPAPSFHIPERHEVLGTPLQGPFPPGLEIAYFGLGCFWGAERLFWQLRGVYSTAVGYAGGFTPHPTYQEVCSGRTGHAEIVQVVYDPQQINSLLTPFENVTAAQVKSAATKYLVPANRTVIDRVPEKKGSTNQ